MTIKREHKIMVRCPPISQILLYIENGSSLSDKEQFLEHIEQCRDCQKRLQFVRQLAISIQSNIRSLQQTRSECLDEVSLSAFAEGKISGSEAEKVLKHLLICDQCLNKLLNLEYVLKSPPIDEIKIPDDIMKKVQAMQPDKDMLPIFVEPSEVSESEESHPFVSKSWRDILKQFIPVPNLPTWGKISLAFGIAVLLLMLLYRPLAENNQNIFKSERAGRLINKIELSSPKAEIPTLFPEFVWEETENVKDYIIKVWSDELGKVIWCDSTRDNRICYPTTAPVKLKPNRSYSWQIEAILNNGERLTSVTHNFIIIKENLP